MPTVNRNVYLRDGISLVDLLRLFCPLYSFVPLLPNNRLDSSTLILQILSVTSDQWHKIDCNYDNVKLCNISKG